MRLRERASLDRRTYGQGQQQQLMPRPLSWRGHNKLAKIYTI